LSIHGVNNIRSKVVLRIRSADRSDCQAITTIHIANWRITYKNDLSDEYLASDIITDRSQLWAARFSHPSTNQYILVAEDQGQIIGFACAYGQESDRWGTFLDNLHVLPSRQGQQIGTTLLHAVAETSNRLYPDVGLYLWVLQSNNAA
jgi:ribosomal protein S18 acetylase RimI-like enzyme